MPYDPLVNFDAQDREMALADLANDDSVSLSPEARTRLSASLLPCKQETQARITLPPPSDTETSPLTVPIRALADFLMNPAEARLRHQLYLLDEGIDESAEQETEPFASAYPTDLLPLQPVRERYVRRAVQTGEVAIDAAGFFTPSYEDAHQRSLTPDGVFARLDAEKLEHGFVQSVTAHDGLQDLLQRLCAHPCRTVSLGMPRQGETTRLFPATALTCPARPATVSRAPSAALGNGSGH